MIKYGLKEFARNIYSNIFIAVQLAIAFIIMTAAVSSVLSRIEMYTPVKKYFPDGKGLYICNIYDAAPLNDELKNIDDVESVTSGNTVQEEFQVPFKTLGDNCTISSISFLDDNALDTESFFKLKKAFCEVLTCNVNFPPIDTIDMAEIKFYNSVIFMSVAVAIASAINLAMLFRYIIRSRAKQTAIFMLCGCTSNKIRRMYIAEIGMISVTIYVIFALVFNYALLPKLTLFFEYIKVAYNFRVYMTIFGIYIISIYLFLNIVILFTNKRSPVKMMKERGK